MKSALAEKMKKMLRTNLGLNKEERLLVLSDEKPKGGDHPVSDDKWRDLNEGAMLMAEVAGPMARQARVCLYRPGGSHGSEPPGEAWEEAFGREAVEALAKEGLLDSLLDKSIGPSALREAGDIVERFAEEAVETVVALTAHSTSHTRFRGLLTSVCRSRYASMPMFDMEMFFRSMDVDYRRMARRTKRLARLLTAARGGRVRAPGTDMAFGLDGREGLSDTGLLTKPGSFGNLPAGEAFIAPVEGTAEGKLSVAVPDGDGREPLVLFFEKGSVVGVEGSGDFSGQWRRRLAEHRNNGNLAEFGIGTNDRAADAGNILEAEKIIGTVHLALGDNRAMGGLTSAPIHVDFVLWKTSVRLSFGDGTTSRIYPERLGASR